MVTGQELEGVSDADLPQLAESASVFARTTPEHKLRIVRALQSRGHTVAMTGDGVNDAPSLKQADIGIAMGNKGTEAAKEASEMVLADDNFASIDAAVHEGRAVYDNIRKVIAWTLPTNGGEALAVVLAILFGWMLPMTPAQILWINMVLTVTLGLSLAFEPPEHGVMSRPPRRRDAALVSPFMLWRIVLVSVLFSVGAFGIFGWAQARGHDIATARTMVVNMFCVMEIFYLFSVRYLHGTSFSLQGLRGTPAVLWAIAAVVLAQLAFTYLPWMHLLFDSRPVPLIEGMVIVLGVAMMVLLEGEKWVLRKLDVFDELRPRPGAATGARGATTSENKTAVLLATDLGPRCDRATDRARGAGARLRWPRHRGDRGGTVRSRAQGVPKHATAVVPAADAACARRARTAPRVRRRQAPWDVRVLEGKTGDPPRGDSRCRRRCAGRRRAGAAGRGRPDGAEARRSTGCCVARRPRC